MLYVQAKNHGGVGNYPIQRIVMHGTVSACVPGGALAVAKMFRTTSRDASTQYVTDPSMVVQCVPENVIAYGAPPNKGSIHVEQCDPQTGKASRWQDANHQSMLRVAAKLVAHLCLKYDIPIRKIGPSDLLAGRKGICGHKDVSDAWHQTDHVDPGTDYPWDQFLTLVLSYAHPTKKKVPKMEWLASTTDGKGSRLSAVFLCDGISRRHVINERHLQSIQERLRAFGLPDSIAIYGAGELAAGIAGLLVGPDADAGTY